MSDSDPNRTLSRAASRPGSRRTVRAMLRAVYPPGLKWQLPLGEGRAVIGRVPPGSAVSALIHETVSRVHCSVEWNASERVHMGADLGSHNGTRIDAKPVADDGAAMRDGSIVQLGDVLLVYERGRGVDAKPAPDVSRDNIPGESAAIRRMRASVQRAADDPSPVLLIGETGTGKEWIARELHRLSARSKGMLAVNCSALSPQLIDSQLFGHVRGAFTGANNEQEGLFRAADGGTLFLDEIGELPVELQPKLLRVLQEGQVQPVGSTKPVTVDVRVIAATNRDLTSSIDAGDFRRDLYARLALWEIRVPPLRSRRADILSWLDRLHRHWVSKRGERVIEPLSLHPEVAEIVVGFDWRENLRGLDRLIHELASSAAPGHPVSKHELPPWLYQGSSGGIPLPPPEPRDAAERVGGSSRPPARKPVPTREEFIAAFEELGGSVRAIAKRFGRDRRQIYRWIEAHGLKDRRKDIRDGAE